MGSLWLLLLKPKTGGDLLNFFTEYKLYANPSSDFIREQVTMIAWDIMVDRPATLISLMRKGIPEAHCLLFLSRLSQEHITVIFAKQAPTTG